MFELDIPDARGLAAVTEVTDRHSRVPIVLLTEREAKARATSAFRRYVWDYLVKPVSVKHLCNCLVQMEKSANQASQVPNVNSVMLAPANTLAPAVSYITTNYPEKLCQATAAKLCDLSPFQFSRVFKKEHGVTFRDFVVQVRISRAAELMKQSRVSVTEAAFVVGFNDLSHFARMFRRQLGVCPSHYRSDIEAGQLPLFPPQERQKR
jgi:AraC-like DNA-binding protein